MVPLFGCLASSETVMKERRMYIALKSEMKQYKARFIRWFGNLPIKSKILLLYVPLIVVPLLILGLVSNLIFVHVTVDKMTRVVEDDSRMISMQIGTNLSNMENCANITALNLIQFYRSHSADAENEVNALILQKQLENVLRISKVSFDDVDSILFIDSNQKAVTLNPGMLANLEKGMESNLYQRILRNSPANVWFPMDCRDFFTENKEEPVLTLGKRVIDVDTGDTLGILILNRKESSITDLFPQVGKNGKIVVLDSDGKAVISSDSQELLRPFGTQTLKSEIQQGKDFNRVFTLDGEKTLAACTNLSEFRWKLLILIPFAELTEGVGSSTLVMLFLLIAFMILILLAAVFLSNQTAKPIVMLTEKMREVQNGNFSVSIHTTAADEVGELATGFQEMMDRINDLTRQTVQKQKRLREYELALIQAQIKPHFLYNSLGLIYTLCGMSGAKEAQTAAKSLADFYRGVLSEGREIISVEEEIQNVRNYLYIQSKRFSNMFTYEISVDEKLLHKRIPKLSLQPIVENSIHHGLVPKGGSGYLQLLGRQEGSVIVFTVTDNGVGMDEKVLSRLLERNSASEVGDGSFGIRSVQERFRLFYGEQYGVSVQSKKDQGTRVSITMPFNGE